MKLHAHMRCFAIRIAEQSITDRKPQKNEAVKFLAEIAVKLSRQQGLMQNTVVTSADMKVCSKVSGYEMKPEETKKYQITNKFYFSEPTRFRLAVFNMPFKILLTFSLLEDIIISYKAYKYRKQYIRRRKPNDIYRICN